MWRALPFAILAVHAAVHAAAPPAVRVLPLGGTAAVSVAGGGRSSADARLVDVGAALARRIAELRDAAAATSLTPAQQRTLEVLQRRARQPIELRIRPETGTPRVLRAPGLHPRSTARAAGDVDVATAREFLAAAAPLLRLDDPANELALVRKQKDQLGKTQVRFAQRWRGLRVWPADVVVQLDAGGDVEGLTGAFVATPKDVTATPSVSQADAITRARAAVPGGDGTQATAELLVHAPGDQPAALAWLVTLSRGLDQRWQVVVDARDGSIRTRIDAIQSDAAAGSGVDLFGNPQSLSVWAAGGTYFLVDTSKSMYDPTSDPPSPDTTRGAIIVLDAREQSPDSQGRLALSQVTSLDPNAFTPPDAVSAAAALGETFDYYASRHGRSSIDGQGGTMLGVVRYQHNYPNAFWNGSLMVFGNAEPYAGALDVVAHELTHGVTQHTANLVYQNQSGAMNEAMSDVFGETTEGFVAGGLPDWLIGTRLSQPLRNMANPGAFAIGNTGRNYPSTMSEYIQPDDPFLGNFNNRDNGGVHLNSGIVNRAYYLLAAGLPDNIGIDAASRVFYQALTAHLNANSQFVDLRLACEQSVAELFPGDAARAAAVSTAFATVGIGDGAPTPPPPSRPPQNAADALVFLASDQNGVTRLARRETALGDPPIGGFIAVTPAALRRPSVTGDGTIAAFVSADFDICLVETANPSSESCLGRAGFVYAASLSRDGTRAGIVLRDALSGLPENQISVLDLVAGTANTFPLRAPQMDGGGLDTVAYAEAMQFTSDNRWLIYDALNQISLLDGSSDTRWSIFALDVAADATYVVVPPDANANIAFPALAQTTDGFMVFDARSISSGDSSVQAADINSGSSAVVAVIPGGYGVPFYSGDDGSVLVTLGAGIVAQPVANRQTPAGDAVQVVPFGGLGVVYRRAPLTQPGGCTSDAECADTDPCSVDTCAGGACQHAPAGGVDAATCVFGTDVLGAACGGDPGYGALSHKVAAAQSQAFRAAATSSRKRARASLRRAAKLLGKATKVARKLGKRHKLSDGCLQAAQSYFPAARAQIQAVARSL